MSEPSPLPIPAASLPAHIAIIMDGNGRWAQERGLSRSEGHKAGVRAAKAIVTECRTLGIRHLTDVYKRQGLGKFAKMELAAGKSGLIGGYLHSNGKLAVLVEMQTGSDAAAASEAFHEVAKNVAMQIAAASPLAVSAEGLNPEVVEHEREVYRQKAREEGKPEQIIEKIAEGAVKKFCKDCLLYTSP